MTKKTLLIAVILSFALCGYAQKGEKGIGGHLGIKCPLTEAAKDYSGYGFGIEYMKFVTDQTQILPYVCYYPENSEGYSPYLYVGIDCHYFINDNETWRPYFIGGLYTGGDLGIYGFSGKFGGGINYSVNDALDYKFEICIDTYDMFMEPLPYFQISVGVTYTLSKRENRNTNRFMPIYIPYNMGISMGTGKDVNTTPSSTTTTTKRNTSSTYNETCSFCNGKGWTAGSRTPTYGSTRQTFCKKCNAWVNPSHSHDRCPSCGGKGYRTRIK